MTPTQEQIEEARNIISQVNATNGSAAKGLAIALYQRERTEKEKVKSLARALIKMHIQYCRDGHSFMSAGEASAECLESLNYAKFDMAGRIKKIMPKGVALVGQPFATFVQKTGLQDTP